MVNNVTSLTGNGLKDWLVQRVTAVYFAAYSFFIIGFLLLHPELGFAQWHALFPILYFGSRHLLPCLRFHCMHG